MNEKELLEYACLKFEAGRYGEALEAFILAYQKGYEKEWILQTLYECYINPNTDEFYKNYQSNISRIQCKYEECILDFFPYLEGKYYIFDRELKTFLGIYDVEACYGLNPKETFMKDEFSSVVAEFDWDYRKITDFISAAKEKSVYLITTDSKRADSFWKIPEFAVAMQKVKIFESAEDFQIFFHTHTDVYLPRQVFTENNQRLKELSQLIEKEHQYRITAEGRNTDHIILTIGIPTHNRGNILLKRLKNLMEMPYDAEIEIVVSKNGNALYQEEYQRVSQIEDARLRYFNIDQELKPHENWYNVIKNSKGKFVLLISDEDDLNIDALGHYLYLLKKNPQLSQVRAKTTGEYARLEKAYGEKGVDAFSKVFLQQNYLSGLIVNREIFLEQNVLKYDKYKDNVFYQNYPHEWWCAALSMAGDCMREPVTLVIENDNVLEEEITMYEKMGLVEEGTLIDKVNKLVFYATYESRFEQFQGQVEFLELFMKDNQSGTQIGLRMAIHKLAYLLKLARRQDYKKEIFEDVVEEFVKISEKGMDELRLSDKEQVQILMLIKYEAIEMINYNNELLENERKPI